MNVASNSLVRTVLPLVTWKLQKACGPVFERSEWKAIALSFVPPPENLINVITREFAGVDCLALLSASHRRRVRNRGKRLLKRHFLNNPMTASAVREHLLHLRQEMEAAGNGSDPARIRKLRDLEAETNEYYSRLAEHPELPEEFGLVSLERAQDIVSLLWEFALYGEGGNKPKIRRTSGIWKALAIDPDELMRMSEKDGLLLFLSRFEALFGLRGQPPEEHNLLRLLRWVVKTHLHSDREPETTPEALNKAIIADLIHRGIKVIDEESEEVVQVDVEDKSVVQPEDMLAQKLSPDEIIEWLRKKGINRSDLTEQDWRLILSINDAFNEGAEIGSKNGLSLHAYFGAYSANARKQLSRLRERLKAKKP